MDYIVKDEESTVKDCIFESFNNCVKMINKITTICDHQEKNIKKIVSYLNVLAHDILSDNGSGNYLSCVKEEFVNDMIALSCKIVNTERAFKSIDHDLLKNAEIYSGIKKQPIIDDLKLVNTLIPMFEELGTNLNKLACDVNHYYIMNYINAEV